ncbi:MAG: aminoacyl-tRNA hydrolase [Thermodesulfobacteriota bacterium]|nr:aminoacyl-tRNA hydrolase [Thermodesulfobacteriota bacterium]
MYLIVGLGNFGPEYKATRHNIGFEVIDLMSRRLGARLTSRRFQSKNVITLLVDKKVMLLCPLTFMNQSGKSVRACADYYGLESANILVIHDDLDLPVGKMRVIRNGGAGGHRGVLSVIQHLGTAQFPRVKIGIGRPRYAEAVDDYVLSPFYSDEKSIMEMVISVAVEACELFVLQGVESVMNRINCQNLANKEVKD